MEISVQLRFVQEVLGSTGALELDSECASNIPYYSIVPLP